MRTFPVSLVADPIPIRRRPFWVAAEDRADQKAHRNPRQSSCRESLSAAEPLFFLELCGHVRRCQLGSPPFGIPPLVPTEAATHRELFYDQDDTHIILSISNQRPGRDIR